MAVTPPKALVDLSRARAAAVPTSAPPATGMPAVTLRPDGLPVTAGPPRLVERKRRSLSTPPSVPVAGWRAPTTSRNRLISRSVARWRLGPRVAPRMARAPSNRPSAALAGHTARIGTCEPNLHTTWRIFSLLPGKQRRRVMNRQRLAACARIAQPARSVLVFPPFGEFPQACADRGSRQSRRLGHPCDSTAPERPCLHRSPTPSCPLVEQCTQRGELLPYHLCESTFHGIRG